MYIQQVNQDGVSIALIRSEKPLMTDVQSALDLMMTVRAETGCKRIALNREAITGDFFVLSTGIGGEILQKFVNYGFKLAVYGDFAHETSVALAGFHPRKQRRTGYFLPARRKFRDGKAGTGGMRGTLHHPQNPTKKG